MPWSSCFSVDRLDCRFRRRYGVDRRVVHRRCHRQIRRGAGHGVLLPDLGGAVAT